MSSRLTFLFTIAIAFLCMIATSHAQSGSRSFAPAPQARSFAPAQSFAPAPQARSFAPAPQVRSFTPAPQPFASSSCPNCQLNSVQSAPQVTYSAPQQVYSAPVQYSQPVSSAPVYSSYPSTFVSRPAYQSPAYSAPVQSYRPVYQSYSPGPVYSSGCGGF